MSRSTAPSTSSAASRAASKHSPNRACSPPPAVAMPASGRFEHRRGLAPPDPAEHSAQVHPWRARPSGRRRSPRPCRSPSAGCRDRLRGGRPGTGPARDTTPGTPRSAGTPTVATWRWRGSKCATASSKRCSMRANSPSIPSPRECSHGSSTTASHRCTAAHASAAAGRLPDEMHARALSSQLAACSHGRSSSASSRRLSSASAIASTNRPWCDTT